MNMLTVDDSVAIELDEMQSDHAYEDLLSSVSQATVKERGMMTKRRMMRLG